MNKDMTHSFNLSPIHFTMPFSVFYGQHIYCLANYFHKLNKTIENNRISLNIIKTILFLILEQLFDSRHDMFKPAPVFNFLSHK